MIEISNVSKTYETGNKAIKDVSLTIDDGEFVFIVGRSGSGKSTLMKLLLKELEPTKGRIVVNDMDLGRMPRRYVPKYRRRLGVVFQDFRLLKDRTVFENVAFAQRVIGVKQCRRCSGWSGCRPSTRPTPDSCPEASSREWPSPGL